LPHWLQGSLSLNKRPHGAVPKDPFQGFNVKNQSCIGLDTFVLYQVPPGCSVSYEVYENGQLLNRLTGLTSPGTWTTPIGCSCGPIDVKTYLIASGTCGIDPGTYLFHSENTVIPCPSPTPTPEPTATPGEDGETCEDISPLFPSYLTESLNTAQNMLQPISDAAPMHQDLGNWQSLLKKIKDHQAKIADEQAKSKPNTQKIAALQAQMSQTQAQATQLQTLILNRLSYMDSARPALRSELNSVAQQPDFSQDRYADSETNPLPQTLEEYSDVIASLVGEFELRMSSENTYDLLTAASILADEQELYGHLLKDILTEKLPFIQEEPTENPQDASLEQINTPRKLLSWLGEYMVNQATKLQNKQQQLNQEVLQDAEELKSIVLESQELLQKAMLMTMHDARMINLETLEVHLPSGEFAIQQSTACYAGRWDQPLHCDGLYPNYVPNEHSFSELLNTIVQTYGSVGNFLKQVQAPYMEEVAKRLSGYSEQSWADLKNTNPQAALDLVNAFTQVAAPIVPQDPIDFIPMGGAVTKGAKLTAATAITLLQRSDALLKSLAKKYANDPEMIARIRNLKTRLDAKLGRIIGKCSVPALCKVDVVLLSKLEQFLPKTFIEKLARENVLADAGKVIKPGAGANLNRFNEMLNKANNFIVDPNKGGGTAKAQLWVLEHLNDFKNLGVQRNPKTSFPDLRQHELARADLGQIKGNVTTDFSDARKKVAENLYQRGYISRNNSSAVQELESKLGLTWHHNEDLKTMQLVPRGIHEPIDHMGGVSIMKQLNTKNSQLTKEAYNKFISGNF